MGSADGDGEDGDDSEDEGVETDEGEGSVVVVVVVGISTTGTIFVSVGTEVGESTELNSGVSTFFEDVVIGCVDSDGCCVDD